MDAPLPTGDRPTVTVCRGCCCGTTKKRPGVDHAARLDALRTMLGDRATLRVTDCLGPCERSDVVVVSPSREARRSGARPVWLGRLNGRHETSAIADWVGAGGPGVADLPESLRRSPFRPTPDAVVL
ncbi:(2Fe-2S) ferredoxin [Nocardioides sp. BE266]|uniref:(2Fe-2S) ferredoxin domain-containing protein n=1 Tax=Nocardioides sp. BE266 TaxID=2817725 RepID=UPI00285D1C24|nr:(2Fe-2S) ferredoxin domain-containing protein [Nocardioides sp. BE266]MDR7255428.1 (2Fe-2S) ferredoxin [Nocardioides sp. BE266]